MLLAFNPHTSTRSSLMAPLPGMGYSSPCLRGIPASSGEALPAQAPHDAPHRTARHREAGAEAPFLATHRLVPAIRGSDLPCMRSTKSVPSTRWTARRLGNCKIPGCRNGPQTRSLSATGIPPGRIIQPGPGTSQELVPLKPDSCPFARKAPFRHEPCLTVPFRKPCTLQPCQSRPVHIPQEG